MHAINMDEKIKKIIEKNELALATSVDNEPHNIFFCCFHKIICN
jgi:hypothetical protein